MSTPGFGIVPPEKVQADLRRALERPATFGSINDILRLLAKHRSHMIQWELVRQHGSKVLGGPFAGMDYLDHGSEGCHVPKLLGCYEHELHPFIQAAIETGYGEVVNIGCAEGYYACGLALRMPATRVHAFDTDPKARELVSRVLERNAVSGRVRVGGAFGAEGFAGFAGRRVLFLIDIEGAESALIGDAQGLHDFDFIIECHDAPGRSVSTELRTKLESSHAVRLVPHSLAAPQLPAMFAPLGHFDQLLAVWEWREAPTPWLVAAARRHPDSPLMRLI